MSQLLYGIDLAKHSFSIHGEDSTGKVLIHKTITRSKVLTTFANIPPAIIGMEACGTSHYWARELTKLGHTPKIMAAKYVAPFRTGAKNDLNDAVAICVAVPVLQRAALKSNPQTNKPYYYFTEHVRAGFMNVLDCSIKFELCSPNSVSSPLSVGMLSNAQYPKHWKMPKTNYLIYRERLSPIVTTIF
ncbi:transposase [Photobacterium profundum 3TCK]|uniref:Transposase n=1 Tax=Photobacterium profundum 3TCK TaxID=314280 RepID=Q1YWV5_9GAMM|nr:transposase [Photobacterium profundum 3TCK]